MGIFSRSKKRKETTPVQPQPQTQTKLSNFYLQSNQTRVDTPLSRPQWTEQRPRTSHGYRQQPQGWLVVPVSNQLQLSESPQNRYAPPQQPPRPQKSISRLNLASMTNLLQTDVPHYIPGARIFNDGLSPLQMQGTQYLNQGAALCDQIASKLNEIITLIDGENFSGRERDLAMYHQPEVQPLWQQQQPEDTSRGFGKTKSKGMVNNSVSSALTMTNYFAKVNHYANSRLPPSLPPLKL